MSSHGCIERLLIWAMHQSGSPARNLGLVQSSTQVKLRRITYLALCNAGCRADQHHKGGHMWYVGQQTMSIHVSSWSCIIMVMFHHGHVSSWSCFIMVMFHHGHVSSWSCIIMVMYHHGHVSSWSCIIMVITSRLTQDTKRLAHTSLGNQDVGYRSGLTCLQLAAALCVPSVCDSPLLLRHHLRLQLHQRHHPYHHHP